MTRMSDDEFESIGDDGILSKGFTAIYVEAKRARAAELRYKEALKSGEEILKCINQNLITVHSDYASDRVGEFAEDLKALAASTEVL